MNAWCLIFVMVSAISFAQESPYFVTYDHHLEERGNLAVETATTMGIPQAPEKAEPVERGQSFYAAPYIELEYGLTNRLTASAYLEGQGTLGDSALFTGWRVEGRYRPLAKEHRINPVFYLEYESLNDASRIAKDIVGNGPDLDIWNSSLRTSKAHELETKLILSSDMRGWNVAENFIVDKNLLRGEGFEFGYAVGVSKPLAKIGTGRDCALCRQRFVAGLELYGGLGSTIGGVGLQDTAQYVAPTVSWSLKQRGTVRFSTAVGFGHESSRILLRVGYSFDLLRFRSEGAEEALH
jgi:hypothetical protein